MSHEVESMAWAHQVPWHGLGVQIPGDISTDDMLVKAGLNWEVKKQQAFCHPASPGFGGPEQLIPVKDQFALVRSTDNTILSACGRSYLPVQNKQAFDFMREFVENGGMTLETAGSLNNGKRVWALASIKAGFTLAGGDEVKGYLLFLNPHIVGFSLQIMYTSIRVVCANTLSMALGAHKRNNTQSYRHTHFSVFDASKAKIAMGLATEQTEAHHRLATLLSTKRIDVRTAQEFFGRVFEPVRAANGEDLGALPRVVKCVELLDRQPGADMVSSAGTVWGAFNAVTYLLNHKIGRNADTRLASTWFGEYAGIARNAQKLAVEYAKAA